MPDVYRNEGDHQNDVERDGNLGLHDLGRTVFIRIPSDRYIKQAFQWVKNQIFYARTRKFSKKRSYITALLCAVWDEVFPS